MRKIYVSVLFCLCAVFVSAQLMEITGKHMKIEKKVDGKTVTVIVFDTITSSTEIKYTNINTNDVVRFYKYADIATGDGYSTLNPQDATGYISKINDVPVDTIWVIDYSQHKPMLKSIFPDPQSNNPCESLNLKIEAINPPLTYSIPSGNAYQLQPRTFKLKYATSKWSGTNWVTDTIRYENVSLSTTDFEVTPPLCNTQFILWEQDQYTEDINLGLKPVVVKSLIYEAVAVEAHLKTVVTERSEKNEASRPQDNQPISYSVPIDVQFQSNANDAATFFNWKIYKDNQLITNRTDRDHRYSFTDYGTYKVVLTVSNPTCLYTDSVTINAYEAAIQVPNVFTPNGDGFNDEFRVAYKSLLSFECWIYNRWGRKLYHWNDPQKGWDGKIAGKDAAEGAYFYVIKATGYGLDPKTKHDPKIKSTITLSGSVALIRGKE